MARSDRGDQRTRRAGGGSGSQGVIMDYEVGKQWGIRENLSLGKVYDHRFVPIEIKLPILRSGWDVCYGLW